MLIPDFEASHLNQLRSARGRSLIYTDNDHVAEFDRDELRQIVTAAGLRIIAESYVYGVMRWWCSAYISAVMDFRDMRT